MTMYSTIITRRGVLVGITASGIASPSLKGGTSSKRLAWPDKPTLPIRCDTRTFLGRAIARPSLGRGEIALPSKSLFAVALALAPLSTGDAHDIYDGSLSRTRHRARPFPERGIASIVATSVDGRRLECSVVVR